MAIRVRDFLDPQYVEIAKGIARQSFAPPHELRNGGLKPILKERKGRGRMLRRINEEIQKARASKVGEEEIRRLHTQRRELEIAQFAARIVTEAARGRRII